MYHVNGIVGLKILSNGAIGRNEQGIKYQLNTEQGVVRFIEEYNPWVTITVKENKLDVTERFREHIVLCGSRTNRPSKVSKY